MRSSRTIQCSEFRATGECVQFLAKAKLSLRDGGGGGCACLSAGDQPDRSKSGCCRSWLPSEPVGWFGVGFALRCLHRGTRVAHARRAARLRQALPRRRRSLVHGSVAREQRGTLGRLPKTEEA